MDSIPSKIKREIKANVELICSDVRTFVIVAAVAKDFKKNYLTQITCKKGLPIAGYVYDCKTESYIVDCVEYIQLGYTPVSFFVKVKGVGNWRKRLPMPEATIKRWLTTEQKEDLKKFKSKYPLTDFDFNFIQFLDCHISELIPER